MKLTSQEQQENALDFIGMSESPEVCLSIDRAQLAEQMQYTNADTEDIEAIAQLIEATAKKYKVVGKGSGRGKGRTQHRKSSTGLGTVR
jgi:hypothetical protein